MTLGMVAMTLRLYRRHPEYVFYVSFLGVLFPYGRLRISMPRFNSGLILLSVLIVTICSVLAAPDREGSGAPVIGADGGLFD